MQTAGEGPRETPEPVQTQGGAPLLPAFLREEYGEKESGGEKRAPRGQADLNGESRKVMSTRCSKCPRTATIRILGAQRREGGTTENRKPEGPARRREPSAKPPRNGEPPAHGLCRGAAGTGREPAGQLVGPRGRPPGHRWPCAGRGQGQAGDRAAGSVGEARTGPWGGGSGGTIGLAGALADYLGDCLRVTESVDRYTTPAALGGFPVESLAVFTRTTEPRGLGSGTNMDLSDWEGSELSPGVRGAA